MYSEEAEISSSYPRKSFRSSANLSEIIANQSIGHFRVALNLIMKARVGAKF